MKSNASISNHRSEVMLERSGRGALIGALVDRALCPRTLDIGAGPAAAAYALTGGYYLASGWLPSSREAAKLIVMPTLIAYAWLATVVVTVALAAPRRLPPVADERCRKRSC